MIERITRILERTGIKIHSINDEEKQHNMRFLVIEDDKDMVDYITKGLMEHGHVVDKALDGKDGLFFATTEKYDAIVMDRMLPNIDGMTILQSIRGAGNKTPVLILSTLGSVQDRVKGLKSGCDDYLVKPFSFEELLARLEALVRRSRDQALTETKLTAGNLTMDLLSRRVTRGGKELDLLAREFRLLEFLLQNKGQVVTRTMLIEHVWNYHFDPLTNVIDVHISRLRKKVDRDFDTPLICTIKGAGYIIHDDA
ncbi:MAG: response regulator transcription factor [Rickettsiales bacterium]|jgi:two-component system OmpR family response regulator|nr:response regulator transcription factor [Rickettsiales bacterium]